MKIVGGMSGLGSVAIYSDKFVSTAREENHRGERIVTCSVEPIPVQAAWVSKLSFPLIVSMAFRIWTGMGWGMRIVMLMPFIMYWVPQPKAAVLPDWASTYLPFVQIALFVLVIKKFIGPWHAAEHMAIASYTRTASYKLELMQNEEPVHPKCGGRFIFPLLLVSLLGYGFQRMGIVIWRPFVLVLLMIEATLWADHLVGIERIWGFSHMSVWLQKYVTTSPPDFRHLDVAQFALKRLVRAHYWPSGAEGPSMDAEIIEF